VTNKMSPAFVGVGFTEPGSKVKLLANGFQVGSTVAGSDGRWEITVEPLKDGIYDITSQAEDAAGNFSENGEPSRIEIDTEAPNTPLLDLTTASDTGLSRSDEVTRLSDLIFRMTTTDPAGADHLSAFNFKFRLYLRGEGGPETLVYNSVDDPTLETVDGLTDQQVLQRLIAGVPEGVHNFKLEVEDRAGNISHDFLLNVTVDSTTTAPTLDLISQSDTGMSNSDNVTNKMQPAFTGEGEVGSHVTILADGVVVGSGEVGSDDSDGVPDDGRGTWEVTVEPLADGVHNFVVRTEDLAGNQATSTELTVEIDTRAPNTPFLDLVTSSDTGSVRNDNVTRDTTPTFSMTTTDPDQDLHLLAQNYKFRLYVRPEGGAEALFYNSAADESIPAENLLDGLTDLAFLQRTFGPLPEGTSNFKLEVEDRAGNISDDFLLNVEIDATIPAATIDLIASSDTGMSKMDDVTNKMQPAFAGLGEVGATVYLYANGIPVGQGVVGSDETDFNPGDGLGAWEVTTEPLDDGIYDVIAHVEDGSGNFFRTEPLTIEVDTQAPNTPHLDLLPESDTGSSSTDNRTSDTTPTVTFTTEDPNQANHLSPFNFKYRLYLRPENGQETLLYDSTVDPLIPAENLSQSFTDLGFLRRTLPELPAGSHNLKLEVEDRAGNISTDTTMTVVIGEDPVVPPVGPEGPGPRIANVTRADEDFTSLFGVKPRSGPDPLIRSIVVHFVDQFPDPRQAETEA
ncbi:MAG: Ig-like domain-containing protein, partial [Gammaproteobacteria bacterium]|nr:Ig-like domain-containing protein [Gammaproteobacteria bacterium]